MALDLYSPISFFQQQRIGIAQWCVNSNLETALKNISELGFRFIQLNLGKLGDSNYLANPDTLNNCARYIREKNMIVTAIAVNYINHYPSSCTADDVELTQLMSDAVEVATKLNTNNIILPSFHERLILTDDDLYQQADFIRTLLNRFSFDHLILASENNLDIIHTLKFIQLVNHKNFRINFDIYNPRIYNRNIEEIILAANKNFLPYIHVKDGLNNIMGSANLGAGNGNVSATLNLLNEVFPDYIIILENKYQNIDISLQKDISYVGRFI